MLAALAVLCLPQEQPPIVPIDRPGIDGRGRDPWVFRCIFEDRTRMVVLAPAKDWWMVFNPETCAMHKVWQGKLDFHGKVWDFSQENSRAEGRIFFASPSQIMRLADGVTLPDGWAATGVTAQKDGWTIAPGGKLSTPPIDAHDWQRVFVAFDETGRKSRFDVSIWDDKLRIAPQTFGSATHVSSDTDWQWNFKRIERPTGAMRVQIKSQTSKRLRNFRLYGDKPSWFSTDGKPLKVIWRGYDLQHQTKGVTLRYDVVLPGGKIVHVSHEPDLASNGWRERLSFTGLSGKSVELRREGLSAGVHVSGHASFADGAERFDKDGVYTLGFSTTVAATPPSPRFEDPEPQTEPKGTARQFEHGLSIRVWDLDGKLPKMPTVAEGQRPNYYAVHKTLDVKDGFDADHGPIRDTFAGTATGWLRVPRSGPYRLRITCDDGAKMILNKRQVLDTESTSGFVDEVGIQLEKGDWPLEIPFYEDGGNFSLKLEWMPPGTTTFQVVPATNLLTEPGQTFVTGPGIKRWFFGKDPRAPGDGRPLEGVHPGYRLETIRPPGFAPAVGGLAFLPDGRLAVCTWDQVGAVHILSNLYGPPSKVKLATFAEGLGEPLGLRVIDGDIWVTQKGEVTRLRDTDHDGKADSFDAMAGGWPASHNYHEFTFNLVPKSGKVYLSTSVPLRSGWTYYNPGSVQAYPIPDVPGSVLELDPKTGSWSIYASGLRTPNGMGLGIDGELFVCDNQGSWLPASKLIRIQKGGFYGHQLSPDGTRKMDPPALWLPHGEISNSPSEPTLISKGRFKGQMFFGDVTYGGIQRCNLEKVGGVYQGAVFRFTQGIEAGVNRLAWGPDGALYIGGVGSNGDWNHKNHRFGLQRLVPTTEDTFEIFAVHAAHGGFRVEFTHPVASLGSKNLEMDSFTYEPKELYGGPKVDLNRFPAKIALAEDRKSAFVAVPEMRPGYVYHFRFVGLKDTKGKGLWSTETWYTLNRVPR